MRTSQDLVFLHPRQKTRHRKGNSNCSGEELKTTVVVEVSADSLLYVFRVHVEATVQATSEYYSHKSIITLFHKTTQRAFAS